MKYAIAALLAVHGVAHLVGFLVSWKLMEAPEMPYRTTILQGAVDLADGGIRAYGAIWLILGLGFGASALTLLAGSESWQRMVIALTVISLPMCWFGWPETRVGLMVNLGILALVLTRLVRHAA